MRVLGRVAAVGLAAVSFAVAQPTNSPVNTNAVATAPPVPAKPAPAPVAASAKTSTNSAPAAPQKLDESAFRIIAERNIFNANRSGGRVQLATRRPARIETVTLVGTMAYDKGAFAFFDGSSSEFSKVIQASGVIAGHKLLDVRADSVMLEADGKQIELAVGSQLRREDAGAWLVAVAAGGNVGSSVSTPSQSEERNGESGSRSTRSSRSDSGRTRRTETSGEASSRAATPTPAPVSTADQTEILKRLKERREKE